MKVKARIRSKGRRVESIAVGIAREIQARQLAALEGETDAAIERFFAGEATLEDLQTFKRAMRAAEWLGAVPS